MKYSLVFGLFLLLFAAPFALADSAGSVTVCKGENAVFEFALYNQAEPLTYAITPSGITGTLSTTALSLGRGETANFTFLVSTANRDAGNYPFTIIADGGVSVSRASGLLVVSNCYSSTLALNATSATVERCGSAKVKVSLQNTGSKSDAFALSSSGGLSVSFPQTALAAGPSSQASIDAVVSVPCATAAGTYSLKINASGHSKQSATFTVYVTAPTPTPTPKGCAYSNPACISPKVCQNNACMMPSGCKYSNPACGAGFFCSNASNSCVEVPVPAPVMSLSAVRACKGEVARFKFSISNPGESAAVFNVTVSGNVNGTLSAKSLTVPSKSSENVYYTVNTTRVAIGLYPIALTASNGKASGTVAAQLQVDDCFASNLTLVSAVSGNQGVPTVFPSVVPSVLPTATPAAVANASVVPSVAPTAVANASNATNATIKPVLWAILSQGMVFESGLQKTITVTIRNSADYDVRSVRVLISNMTVSDVTLPSIPAGKSLSVDLVVSTALSKPFNATVRAVGEQGSGETVFFVNATAGKVAATTFKSAVTAVNGSNGSVERVNTTVRLYNYANATTNLTVSVREPSVNVSPATVSIPANSYVELSLSTQLPKGKDYNATLVVTGKAGATYLFPVSLRAVAPSASTGLFSGSLVSMFSLAVVAVGVVLVLFYFARKQSEDDEDEDGEESDEDEKSGSDETAPSDAQETQKEDKTPAKAKKPSKKR